MRTPRSRAVRGIERAERAERRPVAGAVRAEEGSIANGCVAVTRRWKESASRWRRAVGKPR